MKVVPVLLVLAGQCLAGAQNALIPGQQDEQQQQHQDQQQQQQSSVEEGRDSSKPQPCPTCLHKCEVDTLSIIQDQKPEQGQLFKVPGVDAVRKHFGDVSELHWVPIKEQYFSDIDGRTEERVLGTPGGDLGEFILAMDVHATETGKDVTQEYVLNKLAAYISTSKKLKFYWMTTEKAHKCMMASLDEQMSIAEPTEAGKEVLLDKVIEPGNVGNDHVRWMLEDPALYRSDRTTAELVIKGFHLLMWNKTYESRSKLQFSMLKGEHQEKAFLNIETAPACLDQGLAPLISAKGCDNTFFVFHAGAVTRFRSELAAFFAPDDKKLKATLVEKMNVLGTYQMAKTGVRLIKKYPIYTVVLSNSEE